MRVPTPNVSIVDLVATVASEISVEQVNEAFASAAQGAMRGVLAYTDEPLVSSDFNGNPASSIVDAQSTSVMANSMVKVISWYDNEWGYSNRLVDLAHFVGERRSGVTGA